MHPEDTTLRRNDNSGKHTLSEVQRMCVDARYGKKTHYNAAEREQRNHFLLGVPASALSAILGASLLTGSAAQELLGPVDWIPGVLALVVAVLAAIQTVFNFGRQAERHRSVATRFLAVGKECERLIANYQDGVASDQVLHEQVESLGRRYVEIIEDANACPATTKDYRKAREGFRNGEEEYTREELERSGEQHSGA